MKKCILFAILVFLSPVALSDGNDVEFEMKIWIHPNGDLSKPSFQLGKGKVQYRFNDRTLEVGNLRWSDKYSGMYHEDDEDYLDMETFKRYNLSQE